MPISDMVSDFELRFLKFYCASIEKARSQLGQDLLAIFSNGGRPGIFLEIGAAHPYHISNTKLLEDNGWRGCLVEPNPDYLELIGKCRTALLIPKAIVPEESGPLLFRIVKNDPEFSRLSAAPTEDRHELSGRRRNYTEIEVPTVPVHDVVSTVLATFGELDFVSIDIEGLEYEVLKRFPFNATMPRAICVEHNNSPSKEAIEELLSEKGYIPVCRGISAWDGWFVLPAALSGPSPETINLAGMDSSSYDRPTNIVEAAKLAHSRQKFRLAVDLCDVRLRQNNADLLAMALRARSCIQLGELIEARSTCVSAIKTARKNNKLEFVRKHIEPLLYSLNEKLTRQLSAARSEFEHGATALQADSVEELRLILAGPHSFELNQAYVKRVIEERGSRRPMVKLPAATDYVARVAIARLGCDELPNIHRVPEAGRRLTLGNTRVQTMFNGVLVPEDAYYGSWMTKLIETCDGHHEPQEELVFNWLLNYVPNDAQMIELGAYWAFYSAWFLAERSDRARATIVEPDARNITAGLETLRLNQVTANAVIGRVGEFKSPYENNGNMEFSESSVPAFDLIGFLSTSRTQKIDILHADIQGGESELVELLYQHLNKGEIHNLVISTHGYARHYNVMKRLSESGYYILCDLDPTESFSYDGLIVARHRDLPALGYFDVPRYKGGLDVSGFRGIMHSNNTIILDNTLTAGAAVKHEIYNSLSILGYDVCTIGEKLKGNYFIPYKPHVESDLSFISRIDVERFEYKGFNIWDICQGNIGYDIPGFRLTEADESSLAELSRLFKRAIAFIDYFENVLKRHQPKAVVVWGGMFIEPTLMSRLSKRHGIPVFATEFSFDTNCIYFDDAGRIGNDHSFNNRWADWRKQPLSPDESRWISDWVKGNYKGKAKNQPVGSLSSRVIEFIDAHAVRPVLLLGQCYIDTVISYDNPHFADALDAYFSVVDFFGSRNLPLIVKSHPGDKETYKTALRERCEQYRNVIYVGMDQDDNVYRLMDVCSAGVTINSQAGLEMLAKHKPVLCLGRAFYAEAGLTTYLKDRRDLEEELTSLAQSANLGSDAAELVDRYVFNFLNRHLINVSTSPVETSKQVQAKIGARFTAVTDREILTRASERSEGALRIVITHASPSWGGSGYYLQDLAHEFTRLGHQVIVLCEGTCTPSDEGILWRSLEFEGQQLSRQLRAMLNQFAPNVVFEAGVRSKPMRAALEIAITYQSALIVHGEDDEFVPFTQKYPNGNLAILDALDKEFVFSRDVAKFLKLLDLDQLASTFSDPMSDRWVEPVLRSILYHKADGFCAIWHPMRERLEERFGKTAELLPPIVRLADIDRRPISTSQRVQTLRAFGCDDDAIVYFINGTVYAYSEEFSLFVRALDELQKRTQQKICLLVCGEPKLEWDPSVTVKRLGRLGDDIYLKLVKAADVICAPGVNDSFNRYRLSSRLVKGMMFSKPIFTFKTGFAESLEDNVDGFFTHTNELVEWISVLERTLDPETRLNVGARGRKLVEEWFDAPRVAERLAASWQELYRSRGRKAVLSGVVSESFALTTLSNIYNSQVPLPLRNVGGLNLTKGQLSIKKIHNCAALLYGFELDQKLTSFGVKEFYSRGYVAGFAVSSNRSSAKIRLHVNLGKSEFDAQDFRIFDTNGQTKLDCTRRDNGFLIELESWATEFIVFKSKFEERDGSRKIFWRLLDIDVDGKSSRDPDLEEELKQQQESRRKYQVKVKAEQFKRDGTAYFRKADYDNALAQFEQARKLEPENVSVLRLIAESEGKKKEKLAEQLKRLGTEEFLNRNYTTALVKFEEAEKLLPDSVPVLRAVAEAQYKLNGKTKALATLKRAQELSPKNKNIERRIREMKRLEILKLVLPERPYIR